MARCQYRHRGGLVHGRCGGPDGGFRRAARHLATLGEADGEILWRDTAGDIALWGVQNGQVKSSRGLGTVNSNLVVQGGGDFNGDGKIDILWRDTNSGVLSIWFTNGTRVTSAAVVGTLQSNWASAAALGAVAYAAAVMTAANYAVRFQCPPAAAACGCGRFMNRPSAAMATNSTVSRTNTSA